MERQLVFVVTSGFLSIPLLNLKPQSGFYRLIPKFLILLTQILINGRNH